MVNRYFIKKSEVKELVATLEVFEEDLNNMTAEEFVAIVNDWLKRMNSKIVVDLRGDCIAPNCAFDDSIDERVDFILKSDYEAAVVKYYKIRNEYKAIEVQDKMTGIPD